ncbi:MAG TPA: GNAT family N-acetyltransferase, partial [Candidatus Saccharimonadia bacterium]|nr:GNAT family N-acetyltransferase [Candidatus Saccharimonadia bacterium]
PIRLVEAQVSDAGRLLASAFMGDPGTAIVEPDRARHWETTRILFELEISSTLGSVWASFDDRRLVGVAIWLAPGSIPEAFDAGMLSSARSVLGDAATDRWLGMLDGFERVREEAIGAPHWFLALLGVDPVAQGRGVGAALLQVGHDAADRDGHPCFLETFTERNVAYYRHRGYSLTRSTTIAQGVPIHAMTRPPQDR